MKEVAFENATKQFASKKALDCVSVSFRTGKIHALLGENGAGKSTLAALLDGRQHLSSGRMLIDGTECVFRSPRDSAAAGIAAVQQRPLLANGLCVWENIVLGAEPVYRPAAAGVLNRKAALAAIRLLQTRFEISVPLNPESAAFELTADAVFYTALLAALFRKPRMLILDEPSAALDDVSRNLLYACLSAEAERGTGIIVITHNMQEVVIHADTITVFKKGRLAARVDNGARDVSARDILPLMFSAENSRSPADTSAADTEPPAGALAADSSVSSVRSFSAERTKEPVFCVSELTARPLNAAALFNVSFCVRAGCTTVIMGQRESGMETLENCLTGIRRIPCSGFYTLGGDTPVQFKKKRLTPALLRKFGTGIIPFDRTFCASNPALSVAQVAGIYESPSHVTDFAEMLIRKADIAISPFEAAANLSGGMLQRLILAREMHYNPKLLILSEPFQGLDTHSSRNLAELLHTVCRSGTAVLVLTSDAQFLSSYEPDMYVLSGGKLLEGGFSG